MDCYAALRNAGRAAEVHVYLPGGAGFEMTGRTPRCKEWMLDQGFLH